MQPAPVSQSVDAGQKDQKDNILAAFEAIPEPVNEEARQRDALLHAALARLTQGISPHAAMLAWLDWFTHLGTSPGKQMELLQKAVRKLTRLALYVGSAAGHCPNCIEPLPQDRRFDHPDWRNWPFNVIYQSFLLTQQWWWNATTEVRGVTRHHEYMVAFMARQWLDMFSPSNFLFTNPQVLHETVRTGGMNLVRGGQNLWEDMLRLAANRPPVGSEAFKVGKNIAVTPGKVIYRNRLIELIQYEPQTATVHPEPVLLVPSWIMKYYILDLSPSNSLVRHLVDNGHTVFMISWRNPVAEDRDLGLENYLVQGIHAAIDAVAKVMPGRRIHATGYCLGGTMLATSAAVLARENDRRLASLSLLASELDFSEPGELGLFIDESQISFLDDIMWTRGYLDGKEMSGAFALLNSKDLVWSKMTHNYLMGAREPLSDLMAWNADATRLPYRMHNEYLRKLYLSNELAEGRYEVDGRPVALTDIRLPLFVVATERDHVSPWRSVFKVHLLTDTEVTFALTTGGHNVGIVNPPGVNAAGRGHRIATHAPRDKYTDPDLWFERAQWREGSWWPSWLSWLKRLSSAPVAPPAMGAPEADLPPLYDAPGRFVLAP
ncbi:MAG TPA: alpha/beta fold hydrolase [Gammaproteobacteria bacterium]|nr:alpha/beta fold hydrolase [Gammaproteobacteria bacterium]